MEPMLALIWYSCGHGDDWHRVNLHHEKKNTRYIQRRGRNSRATVTELDEIVLAARHEASHRRVRRI